MNDSVTNYIKYNIDNPYNDRPDFDIAGQDYLYFNDINNNNYDGGRLRFNCKSAVSTSSDRNFLLSDAYILVPYEITASLTGGTFYHLNGTNTDLKCAVCLKGPHHIYDQVPVSSFGNVQDIMSSATRYRNLFCNEKLKDRTLQDVYLNSDEHTFDGHLSYEVDNAGIEKNYQTKLYSKAPHTAIKRWNHAFYERNKNLLFYYGTSEDTAVASSMDEEAQNITLRTARDVLRVPHAFLDTTNNTLTIRYMVKISLATISEFYKNLNIPLARFDNMNLELLLNMGTATINYTASNDALLAGAVPHDYVVNNFTYIPRYGSTCPFMVSSASNHVDEDVINESFLRMIQSATGVGIVMTIKNKIGWGNIQMPAQFRVPTIIMKPDRWLDIVSDPVKTIYYTDFYVDEQERAKNGTFTFSRNLAVACNRAVALYILPFRVDDANKRNPLLSPFSSAGNTVSLCKIRDLQVRVGSNSVFFQEVQRMEHQFLENVYHGQGNVTGNAVNSLYRSGLITAEMWKKCYGVYKVDLMSALDKASWAENVLPHVQFTLASDVGYYDFIILLEFGKELTINIATGASEA